MSESLSIGLWNANGLRTTVISEILQYASSFSLLIITESWLRSPSRLPTNWSQYHVYALWRTNCFRYLIPLTKFGRAVDSGNGIVDFFKGLFNFYMKLKFIKVKIKK